MFASHNDPGDTRHVWIDELLIPTANLGAYRLVYEGETWVRRICLAAFMLEEGPVWASSLNTGTRDQLESRSRKNSEYWYLGVDTEEELLWTSTLGQLASILRSGGVHARIKDLCGVNVDALAAAVEGMSRIRNALAHNRAISEDSLRVLEGHLTIIRAAAARFKRRVLYADFDIFIRSFPKDLQAAGEAFETRQEQATRRGHQLFVSANTEFLFLVRLPVEPLGRWPSAARLKEGFGMTSQLLLCAMANKRGDELSIAVPRNLPSVDQIAVIDRFFSVVVDQRTWIETPPEDQHPADVGWARLWFYENREPVR